ncbi:TRAG protein, partial [mine drainage metagenome]
AQDRVQLAKAYSKEESIFSNCHIRIAYAPNNPETADMLSKMCGQATVTHVQRQYSGNRMHIMLQNVNTNEQIVGRPLLTADECMRLPPDDEIVFVAGHAPLYCQKIKYYADSAMACASRARHGRFHRPRPRRRWVLRAAVTNSGFSGRIGCGGRARRPV